MEYLLHCDTDCWDRRVKAGKDHGAQYRVGVQLKTRGNQFHGSA